MGWRNGLGRPLAMASGQRPARLALRALVSLGIMALFLWLLNRRLEGLDWAALHAAFASVSGWQWAGAALATALSFWAVGQYDVTLHRHLRTATPEAEGARAGMAAIAVSQTLGFGLITGALMRWRLLPGASLWHATRLTVAVTVSFLLGWGLVTALVLLVLPGAPFKLPAGLALAGLGMVAAAGLVLPTATVLGQRYRMPNGLTVARLVAMTAIDLGAAALALWLLAPAGLGLSFTALLPAYALALGAGLLSGTPGGVGAFEVTLVALLPGVAAEPLLAAVLAFRAVYYAAPALIGVALALPGAKSRALHLHWPADPELAKLAERAEALLIRQGELDLLPTTGDPGASTWVVGRCPHVLAALHDPLEMPPEPGAFAALARAARAEARLAAIYKCTGRTAARARAAGWRVLPVSREAHLCPADFRLDTPARATLRRKLRKVQAAGVTISRAPLPLPLDEMAPVAAAWAAARGGERGFSMGRFCARYLAGQRVYLAHQGGELVAFASFHEGLQEWVLDLMRQTSDAPDGTMQALVIAALEDAARLGLPRLSLAAVPEAAFADAATTLPKPLAASFARLASAEGAGLMQFKAGFAPRWQRLYMAAPSRRVLALAAAEIAYAILHPAPLIRAAGRDGRPDDGLWRFSR